MMKIKITSNTFITFLFEITKYWKTQKWISIGKTDNYRFLYFYVLNLYFTNQLIFVHMTVITFEYFLQLFTFLNLANHLIYTYLHISLFSIVD